MTDLVTFANIEATGLVVHGFSTRQAGNLALHVGDDPAVVLHNRRCFFAATAADPEHIICAQQVHGKHVQLISGEHMGRGALDYDAALPATDGMITNEPGITLTTFYADCVPLFFLDPVQKAIGLSHAGWKGTVLGIGPETVQSMVARFGSKPDDILVGIGPSIGPCCYEVDQRVYEQVEAAVGAKMLPNVLTASQPGHWYLDLWKLNAQLLQSAGIKEQNISVAKLCTACNVDRFFSHRQEQGQAGRMAAFMRLR